MHYHSRILVISLIFFNVAIGKDKKDLAPSIAVVLKQINDGGTDKLYSQLNAGFQKAVSLPQLRAVIGDVKKVYGKLGRFTEMESKGPAAIYRVQGEKGFCLVTLSVDSAGKISGLTITADSANATLVAEVLKWINDGVTEKLYAQMNTDFQKAVSLVQLSAVTSEVKKVYGKLGLFTKKESNGASHVYRVEGEKAFCLVTLSVDSAGKFSGLLITADSTAVPPIADILKRINASEDDKLYALMNADFQKAIPKRNFLTVTQQVRKQFGKLDKWTEQDPDGDAKVYRVRAEKGHCIVKITLDKQGKIAGLQITPDQPKRKKADVPGKDGPSGNGLASLVTDLRTEKKLVGLAAMVMVDGQVVASAADGERKIDSGVPIEVGDRWHVGSITKSITATMIARLVEAGQLKWTDTVGERFSDATIHPEWKQVTLRQLLTHTSGAPANFSLWLTLKKPALGPECTRERRKAVLDVLAQKPSGIPGEKFTYSNVGYTIAGAMAESETGVSWEDLMKREVFEPHKLTDVGFGPPKSPSKTLDQPRGHQVLLGSKVSVDDSADNTPIIGPAGTVHMTLANLCTYATEHLHGELGSGKLLTAETYKRLHTPELNGYACGWMVKQPTDEIPYESYWHNGSNTMWYALVVFIPGTNMVVAVTSNDGDIKQAESAAWALVTFCVNQFNVEGDKFKGKGSVDAGNDKREFDIEGRLEKQDM